MLKKIVTKGYRLGKHHDALAGYQRILRNDVKESECIIDPGLRHELNTHLMLLVVAGVRANTYSTAADYNHQDIYFGLQLTNWAVTS
jgi:hypothetical protein